MQWLIIMSWVLATACAAALVTWTIVAIRVQRMMATDPSIRRGLMLPEPAGGWPTLSIIVPAHNEEDMIDRCAESLRRQDYPNLEIIVVCDRCTDATADRLREHARDDERIVVIENEECPNDWAGKCNAARLGAERARGDWLIFTDADTHFDPDLSRAAVALAMDRGLALLSLLTTLTAVHAFERVVQPVASMHLVRMYPLRRVSHPTRARPFANGQFMLFERRKYDEIGGHAAVKDDLLEDIAISRVISKANGRVGIFFADGMLTCAMYESFAAFKEGWKRIFIEACKRKPSRLRQNGRIAIVNGAVVFAVQLAALGMAWGLWRIDRPMALLLIALVGTGWFVQFATLMRIFRIGGAPRFAAFGFPYANIVVGRIMLHAARDLAAGSPIRWGGREYVLKPR